MYDLVLLGGTLVDPANGRNGLWNIGITDGKVAEVSRSPIIGKREIRADGLVVSPGFIDVHGHIDGQDYGGELSACQGITTTVGGNCGVSPVDFEGFCRKQENEGFCINQAELVGHCFTLRQAVGLEDPYAKASAAQIERMAALAEEALLAGACGISLGLDYAPGTTAAEMLAMGRMAHRYKRILPTHTRLSTLHDLYSLYEMLAVAKQSGVRVLFSHFVYQYCGGDVDMALKIVDEGRKKGLDVWIDSGMYTNWTTGIHTATYDWNTLHDNQMYFRDMVVATGSHTGEQMTEELYHLLREDRAEASVIYKEGTPQDITSCLRPSYAMPSTDATEYLPGQGHPQIAGTFPAYIRRMVRETGLLTLEEAIRKATILPAQVIGIENRGHLGIGAWADLVLFDPECIEDRARFPDEGAPDAKPVGIPWVFVNGVPVVEEGCFTGSRTGKLLRF